MPSIGSGRHWCRTPTETETDSIVNLWAHIKYAGLSSILPEYFGELLASDTSIRSIALDDLEPSPRVGLVTLECDPLSPLVAALFETCCNSRFFPRDTSDTSALTTD